MSENNLECQKIPLALDPCKAAMLLLLPAASHAQQHLGKGAVLALYKTQFVTPSPGAHCSSFLAVVLFPPLQTSAASGALQTPPIPGPST